MAATWLKKYLTMKPEVKQIFDDLDAYREFCVEQGYNYDERHLYHEKTPWGSSNVYKMAKDQRTIGIL